MATIFKEHFKFTSLESTCSRMRYSVLLMAIMFLAASTVRSSSTMPIKNMTSTESPVKLRGVRWTIWIVLAVVAVFCCGFLFQNRFCVYGCTVCAAIFESLFWPAAASRNSILRTGRFPIADSIRNRLHCGAFADDWFTDNWILCIPALRMPSYAFLCSSVRSPLHILIIETLTSWLTLCVSRCHSPAETLIIHMPLWFYIFCLFIYTEYSYVREYNFHFNSLSHFIIPIFPLSRLLRYS